MVKKQSLFQNKLFQATLIVSMILVSSAIFISQSDNIFGKAAAGVNITGTIVLHDSSVGVFNDGFSLPGTTCDVLITACSDETYKQLIDGDSLSSPGWSSTHVVNSASCNFPDVECSVGGTPAYNSKCTVMSRVRIDDFGGTLVSVGSSTCSTYRYTFLSGGLHTTKTYGVASNGVPLSSTSSKYNDYCWNTPANYVSVSYSCTP